MGLFKSTRLFYDAASYADDAARGLMTLMRNEGYEVDGTKLPTGGWSSDDSGTETEDIDKDNGGDRQ